MSRETGFFIVLVVSSAAILNGVVAWSVPAAWIVGGVMSSVLGWLVFGESK